jgi:hypothetical protein
MGPMTVHEACYSPFVKLYCHTEPLYVVKQQVCDELCCVLCSAGRQLRMHGGAASGCGRRLSQLLVLLMPEEPAGDTAAPNTTLTEPSGVMASGPTTSSAAPMEPTPAPVSMGVGSRSPGSFCRLSAAKIDRVEVDRTG